MLIKALATFYTVYYTFLFMTTTLKEHKTHLNFAQNLKTN